MLPLLRLPLLLALLASAPLVSAQRSPLITPGVLATTEAGTLAQFQVALQGCPLAAGTTVTVSLGVTDATEGIVTPQQLQWTAAECTTPKTGVVTGVGDSIVDGPVTYLVQTSMASTDPLFNGVAVPDITVTNTDIDVVGVEVEPLTLPMATSEAGAAARLRLRLRSRPMSNVAVPVRSSFPSEGTASPPSVTFTPGDWNVFQTVTVTGVDDAVDDGDTQYSVALGPTQSADASFNGLPTPSVAVVNTDDDTRGFVMGGDAMVTTSEEGLQGRVTIAMTSRPTSTVTVGVGVSDATEALLSVTLVTFVPDAWNVQQTITVTGLDDLEDDGDVPYQVQFRPAQGADYVGIDPPDVPAINLDNDAKTIDIQPATALSPATPLELFEAGAPSNHAVFTVRLTSLPLAVVRIPVVSSDATEGTVVLPGGLPHLVFDRFNFNTPQTVTLQPADDNVVDGDRAFQVTVGAAVGGGYDGVSAGLVHAVTRDNDVAGVLFNGVAAAPSLVVSEANPAVVAEVRVALATEPTGVVQFGVAVSDATEGVVTPSSLAFGPANWNTPQTVRVSPVVDGVDDGDVAFEVRLTTISAPNDPWYSAMPPAVVPVRNIDDDTAGLIVQATNLAPGATSLATREDSVAVVGTISVRLGSAPVANVEVPVASTDVSEGVTDVSLLVFTPANWNVPQMVTLRGVDDILNDGDVAYRVDFGPTRTVGVNDPLYVALRSSVPAINVDDDEAGMTVRAARMDNTVVTDESGMQDTITVSLISEPSADVTVYITPSLPTEAVSSAPYVVFSTATWRNAQSVFITGVDDVVVDGAVPYAVVVRTVSADLAYDRLPDVVLAGTNHDNDVASIAVSPARLETVEGGQSRTLTVVLTSKPASSVSLTVSSTDATEGSVTPGIVTFSPEEWNVPQTVTVTPVSDSTADPDVTYSVAFGKADSLDIRYKDTATRSVQVLNRNVDVPAITVIGADKVFVTGEAAPTPADPQPYLTVSLATAPTADVVIGYLSSDETEGVAEPPRVVFTPANWRTPQTVRLRGVDDPVRDGDVAYTVTPSVASADGRYAALAGTLATVSARNVDNEQVSLYLGVDNIDQSPLYVTREEGETELRIPIRLMSQPSHAVVIAVTLADPTEAVLLDPVTGLVVIQPAAWDAATHTIRIRGVDDTIVDGDRRHTISVRVASSADAAYAALPERHLLVVNLDNDVEGLVLNTAGLPATLSEPGGSSTEPSEASFTVALPAQPGESGVGGVVTVPVIVSPQGRATATPSSLRFDEFNWNVAQTVRVRAVDNAVADGGQEVAVSLGPTTSTLDANLPPTHDYRGLRREAMRVTVADNDEAGVAVSATTIATTESGGGMPIEGGNALTMLSPEASFTVVLTSQPAQDVSFTVATSDATEGLLMVPAPGGAGFVLAKTDLLLFTPEMWNVPKRVSVVGVEDNLVDGAVAYSIDISRGVSADAAYAAVDPPSVTATNADNDAPGFTVSPLAGHVVSEGGNQSTFTVALLSRPSAIVTVALASSDSSEGAVLPPLLTFATDKWNVPQTVRIVGVDDTELDGTVPFTVSLGPARSLDTAYNLVELPAVTAHTLDNEVAPTFAPLAPLPSRVPEQTFEPPPSPAPHQSKPPGVVAGPPGDDDGFPGWAIALIVLTSVLLCCLMLAAAVWWRKKQKDKDKKSEDGEKAEKKDTPPLVEEVHSQEPRPIVIHRIEEAPPPLPAGVYSQPKPLVLPPPLRPQHEKVVYESVVPVAPSPHKPVVHDVHERLPPDSNPLAHLHAPDGLPYAVSPLDQMGFAQPPSRQHAAYHASHPRSAVLDTPAGGGYVSQYGERAPGSPGVLSEPPTVYSPRSPEEDEFVPPPGFPESSGRVVLAAEPQVVKVS